MKMFKPVMIAFIALIAISCDKDGEIQDLKKQIVDLQAEVDAFKAQKELEAQNVALYDEMDLVAFTNHDMDHISRLHADDVVVYNPDMSEVKGMEQHGKDMANVLTAFPDLVIESHPIKFASGDWTAGLAVTKGSFQNPYVLPNGTTLPPSGNKFTQYMITLARWENGQIQEEYLFYDNMDLMKQLGVMKQE